MFDMFIFSCMKMTVTLSEEGVLFIVACFSTIKEDNAMFICERVTLTNGK